MRLEKDVAALQKVIGCCTDSHPQGRRTPRLDAAGDEHGHHPPVQERRHTAGRQESWKDRHPFRMTMRGKVLMFEVALIHGQEIYLSTQQENIESK